MFILLEHSQAEFEVLGLCTMKTSPRTTKDHSILVERNKPLTTYRITGAQTQSCTYVQPCRICVGGHGNEPQFTNPLYAVYT